MMDGENSYILEWQPEFDLGIEEIDLQHRYFLHQINRLYRALQNGDDHAMQVALFKELNAYVKFHFMSEENMMRFAGYEHLAEHKRHHYELIDQLNVKEGGLNLRYSEKEAAAVIEFLVRWFKAHTTDEDKQFAAFLLQRQN